MEENTYYITLKYTCDPNEVSESEAKARLINFISEYYDGDGELIIQSILHLENQIYSRFN